jgi:Peptidase family C25
MASLRQTLLLVFAAAAGAPLSFGEVPRDTVVEVSATVQESPPQITLQWVPGSQTVALQKIYRRLKGAQQWSDLATPANSATSHVDADVSVGVNYEYSLYRILDLPGGESASGYLSAGIRLPVVDQRGKVILLVDDTMSGPLAAEISRLVTDLSGDGWVVLRQDVSRTAAVPAVKAIVQGYYNSDPANTRALILFGRVPVPYSGNLNPDGHPEHQGAWPTDAYYGDVDGSWTDIYVNNSSASRAENRNVPGDGKWDQSGIPSNIELETGRIDLSNMNNVPSGMSETELLRQYLNRDHDFRHKTGAFADIPRRGLIADNFGYANGEAFAASGWRNFASFFGSAPVSLVEGSWFGTLQTNTYLWAYGCGPGGDTYTSADGIGSSSDFATKKSLSVFTALFGSYFGDWDSADNFLRAPLAGHPDSLGLVSIWAGRPHWHLYHMGMGETVGYGARVTQNNTGLSSEGYVVNNSGRGVHIALMGDPTLRLHPVAPVANFSIDASSGTPVLTWTPSADTAVQGYAIYRATTSAGPFIRLGGAVVSGNSYTDRAGQPGQSYVYQVRTVKLESSAGGTYLNNSEGIFAGAAFGAASGPEINLTSVGQPISTGDAASLAANGTDFGSAEVNLQSTTHSFTIANDGTSPLNLTGAPAVALSGAGAADFNVVAQPPGTVASGGAVSFQIIFAPTAVGERTVTVSIACNDPDESPFQFVLSGIGLPSSAGIVVTPVSIARTVNPGNSTTVPLTISDTGAGSLNHTLSTSQGAYSATDSNSFGGPAYSWVEISATGTEVTGFANPDDGISAAIPLGFSFPFYGSSFMTLRVCTNGFISFTDEAAPWGNTPLPTFGAPRNIIAAFWDDLILDAGSKIFTQQMGNMFVVQFNNIALFSSPAQRITCEIILKLSGEILLQYKDVTETDHNYTVGIQNNFRTEGLQLALNTNYVQSGLAIRIAPPGFYSWLTFSANSGTVPPGQSQTITATLDASGLPAGQYASTIYVDSNDASLPRFSIPVRFTVGVTPVQTWRLANFGTTANEGDAADGADPEHDGLSNVLEYALTLDPNAASSSGLPTASTGGGGYPRFEFTRNAARTDVTYTVEASSDLILWTPIARALAGAPTSAITAHSVTESGAGDVKTAIVEDAVPITANSPRFLRLKVTRSD